MRTKPPSQAGAPRDSLKPRHRTLSALETCAPFVCLPLCLQLTGATGKFLEPPPPTPQSQQASLGPAACCHGNRLHYSFLALGPESPSKREGCLDSRSSPTAWLLTKATYLYLLHLKAALTSPRHKGWIVSLLICLHPRP